MENAKSKQILIALLHFIRDCELDNPLGESNEELVDACIRLLLKLQGKTESLTTEQIEDRVRKIPFVISADFDGEANKKVKKHTTKKKILLVAAIIALLAMLMGIVYSNSKDDQFFRDVAEIIGIENVEKGKVYTVNGVSYEENENIAMYEDINDYPEDNPYNILLPTYLPDGIKTTTLLVTDLNTVKEILVGFNTTSIGYAVYLNSNIPQSTLDCCNEVVIIKNKTIHIVSKPEIGLYQMYFEHNNNYYDLNYTNKQEILKVIEYLEE